MSCLVVHGQSWAPDCSDCACSCGAGKDEHLSKFERRKKDAATQATIVRLTWVFLHVSIICSLFTVDTNLSRAWSRPHLPYLVSYLLLAIANLALYVNLCISNPGYLQPGVHALSLAGTKRDSEEGGLSEPSGSPAVPAPTCASAVQAYLVGEDAAELGIGRLAHIDIPLIGRRGVPGVQQRDRQAKGAGPVRSLALDRTSTLPNLPSQFTAEALLDATSPTRAWDEPPTHRSAPHEGTSMCSEAGLSDQVKEVGGKPAANVLSTGNRVPADSRQGSFSSKAVSKVRIRGGSLGCEQDLVSAFGHPPPEWTERGAAEAAEPLLGKESRGDKSAGSTSGSPGRSGDDASLHRKPSKPLSPGSLSENRSFLWWEGPNPGRWCEYCGAWQLLRSRHCHDCGRCVRRFDHHCAWVGRCIGQDNHLMFWWYLAVQLALLSWTTHIIVEGFEQPGRISAARFVTLFTCCVPAVLLTGFVAILLGYHTYLVVTAQTTYELMLGSDGCVGSQVPYMRHLPQGQCPFSQGPTQNVLHFCCDRGSTAYQMPAALSSR